MTNERGVIDIASLVQEIQRGLPATPGGMSEPEFAQLSENIARAIVRAITSYERRDHSQKPEFGEEDRTGL